jgi:hypothetical protein
MEEVVKQALQGFISKKIPVREASTSFNEPKSLLHNRVTGIIKRNEIKLVLM